MLLTSRQVKRMMDPNGDVEAARTHAAENPHDSAGRRNLAMALVAAGVDPTVIALWMGHASPLSTRPYLHADMKLKQQAADRLTPPGIQPGRYHAPDELLAFLAGL